MMQYIDISDHGGQDVKVIKKGRIPDPKEGEVLIRVQAAGVNRPDILQRQGLYPPPPGASAVLGLEVAGEVAEIGKGVDVILDMVGGDYVDRNFKVSSLGGRIVNIAFLKGSRVEVDMLPVLFKRLIVTGSALRPRSASEKAGIAQKLRENIWPLIERGDIKPLIAGRFPLKDAPAAHRLMESGNHIGKIILTVSLS